MSNGVPCLIMRGGTSKAAYFLRDDLPSDSAERDDLILRIVGSPDRRQIDGIGGAHPLTTKVAVVGSSPCGRPSDVDYLFLQPSVTEPLVSDSQNCGNILAGVGPFAVERGLVKPHPAASQAKVRVHILNTGAYATAVFPLRPNGMPLYRGDTAISGVPGTAAPVRLEFSDIAGGSCGALLPTGEAVNTVVGVDCTLIDNGMPVVVMRASDVGVSGYENCATLEADLDLRAKLDDIRLQAGRLMNLGDVTTLPVPKLTLVASPTRTDADICTRTFIPHRCHDAIGVFGALSTAAATLLPGTPANEMLREQSVNQRDDPVNTHDRSIGQHYEPVNTHDDPVNPHDRSIDRRDDSSGPSDHSIDPYDRSIGQRDDPIELRDRMVVIEHPTGTLATQLSLCFSGDGISVGTAGIVRTARKLADAIVFPRPAARSGTADQGFR